MSDYEAKGRVAVWLGSFPDRATFDDYLRETYDDDGHSTCPFRKDLGLEWLDHDSYEAHFEPEGPGPIGQFLQPNMSYIETFLDQLKTACAKQGVHSAGASMFAYDLAYPESRPFPCPYLQFVGNFSYRIEHPEWFQQLLEKKPAPPDPPAGHGCPVK